MNGSPCTSIHRKIPFTVLAEQLVEIHEILVHHPARAAKLAFEFLDCARIRVPEQLHRHFTSVEEIAGLVDRSSRASTELVLQLEAPETNDLDRFAEEMRADARLCQPISSRDGCARSLVSNLTTETPAVGEG